MKNILLLLVSIFGFLTCTAQKHSIEVVYKVAIREDGIYNDYIEKNPESYDLFDGIETFADWFDLQLWIGDEFSFYQTLEVAEPPNAPRSFQSFLSDISYKSNYFFNLKDKKIYQQTFHKNKEILIEANQDNYQWEITDETKDIQGFTCYKALLKFKDRKPTFIAWFAPELPYPTGPLEFVGLPGLILELRTPFYVYGAKSINFKLPYKNIQLPNLPIRTYEEVESEARAWIQQNL